MSSTPRGKALSPTVFLPASKVILHRIVKLQYANLSGLGAARPGQYGRWNREGQRAIYTSLEAGTSILEKRAHLKDSVIPTNLALMRIQLIVPAEIVPLKKVDRSPSADGTMEVYETLASAEQAFQAPDFGLSAFAIAVPSVVAPAWKVILFPRAPGFWKHVSLAKNDIELFSYDSRFFREGAPLSDE